MMLSIFLCTCCPVVCLLWKISIQFFCPFFNWTVYVLLLSCMTSLYILDNNHLSDILFACIFSHYVGYILLCYFFCCGEAFLFDVVPLVHFCFCCLCFWCHMQNIIAKTNVTEIFPYVFLRVL